MTSDEHDDEPTSPGLPGRAASTSAYDAIAGALDGAVRALGAVAEVVQGLEGESRDRMLDVLAIKSGELGDMAHDLRRVIMRIRREERNK